MDIKKNINFIRNEFGSDEQIIESAFKIEVLYRRYRRIIWGVGAIIVGFALFFGIKSVLVESNAKKSSALLNTLLENPDDLTAREDLKGANIELYQLFMLKESLDKGNLAQLQDLSAESSGLANLLANYHLGSFERDSSVLNKSDKFALGHFAKLQEAYILINEGKVAEARGILQTIPIDSELKEIAQVLLHYTIMEAK